MHIRFIPAATDWPMFRQTPGSAGVWDGHRFIISDDLDCADACVVHYDLPKPTTIVCPPSRTVLVTCAPPHPKDTFAPQFLQQFGAVVTCKGKLQHPHLILRQQAQPWFVGVRKSGVPMRADEVVLDYDDFCGMQQIPKVHELSVVCSDVDLLPGHRQRIRFIDKLSAHFGSRIHVYGWGRREIFDKWDGVAPYKYHIAIENTVCVDYWTEKLADAFLAGALPLYHGCPNITDYFEANSLVTIDINNPGHAIRAIEQAMEQGRYEQVLSGIWQARRRVLNEHNFFPMIVSVLRDLPKSAPERLTLKPHKACPLSRATRLRIRAWQLKTNMRRVLFRQTGC
jgi:Glycosyltransferase family 10 (fucosyltransferase) C-term